MKLAPKHRFLVIACSIMLVLTLSIAGILHSLYDASKESIVARWRDETGKLTQKVSHYLKLPMAAVEFSAVRLNSMLKEETAYREAQQYLVDQTEIYAAVISDNTTGVYAFFRGRYLDGSGWSPPADYRPRERPWYLDACESKGDITLVKPYLNLQSKKMMMSVSKLLADKDSVVSMDIFLDGLQHMAEEAAQNSTIRAVIVVDKEGSILAHSDKRKVGIHLSQGNAVDRILSDRIAKAEGTRFELDMDPIRISIGEPLINNWHTLVVLDKGHLYTSLRSVFLNSALFLIFIVGTCLVIFLALYRKNEQNRKLEDEILAAASIYIAMFKIDLSSDSIVCIRHDPAYTNRIGTDTLSFSELIKSMPERLASRQSRRLLESFIRLEPLEKHLTSSNSISLEYVNIVERWVRLSFIVIKRLGNGKPHRVLMTFESIDANKRLQENLRKLSETDRMTGVLNRGSGEALVRQALRRGEKGFFCLLDADKFKFVNDTFGHQVGDRVIIALADSLTKTFRDADYIFRLGGDEFCAFAPHIEDQTSAVHLMEDIFRALADLNIPELQGYAITVSIGATFYPVNKSDSFEAMYQRADEGAYVSKNIAGNSYTIVV